MMGTSLNCSKNSPTTVVTKKILFKITTDGMGWKQTGHQDKTPNDKSHNEKSPYLKNGA